MYTVEISGDAKADLRRLDPMIRARVRSTLLRLQETCEDRPHKALRGRHRGKFSLRVAKHYRIIYTFNRQTKVISVSRIGHRSKVY
ncbi:MAG: type II toxin-antitoxin system RelE/ParE family toxin [Candidatus Poribacteria bacterium]|nr:type II toxin-antitoxin system RelE/ParE family toxin [Candidatus Poribacteria bacterium]